MSHPVYPGGPPCNQYCPGEYSIYHDGYADGWMSCEGAVQNAREVIEAAIREDFEMCYPDDAKFYSTADRILGLLPPQPRPHVGPGISTKSGAPGGRSLALILLDAVLVGVIVMFMVLSYLFVRGSA